MDQLIVICITLSTMSIVIITVVYTVNSFIFSNKDGTADIVQILEKHYNDMLGLTNQFASLSAQLYNQQESKNETPAVFPSVEEVFGVDPTSSDQVEQQEDPIPELQGGRM